MSPRLPPKMPNNYSKSNKITKNSKNRAVSDADLENFRELSEISEEIGECRKKRLS